MLELLREVAKALRPVAPVGRQRTLPFTPGRLEPGWQIGTALMVHGQRRGHEIAPDLSRHRAAADLPQRAVIVPADPNSDDEIPGEADEQRVTIFLRGAGFPEGRDGERGTMARP